MSIILENDTLRIEIQAPGEGYCGSRFDHSAKIVQISYKNRHNFCTTESLDPATVDTLGRGLYNEFGIDAAVGYDGTAVGGRFHKIGTGLVLRPDEGPYDFYRPLDVTPLDYRVSSTKVSAQFSCDAPETGGYAYRLEKTVTLDANRFSIAYVLDNTGSEKIETTEYVHNFLAIDGKPIDSQYELNFPHALAPAAFGETVNPEKKVQIGEHSINWKGPLKEQFFFSHLESEQNARARWTLAHREAGVCISEASQFGALRLNMWGNVHVVSPEIFIAISLEPGHSLSWRRDYEIREC